MAFRIEAEIKNQAFIIGNYLAGIGGLE